MKNTFGQSISLTLFGESHGAEIGAVLDGLAPGIPVDEDFIRHQLSLRRPYGKISTARVEADEFRIVSGVFEGKTTGTPLCVLIPNTNLRSGDYSRGMPRPGHADYAAECKYHGFQDYRGGGHFSGRITAALVAAGAILISALRQKEIIIGTHVSEIAGIRDRRLTASAEELATLNQSVFPVLDEEVAANIDSEVRRLLDEGYNLACKAISDHVDRFDALVKALLERDIGTIAEVADVARAVCVPCEAELEAHLHLEMEREGKPQDPLTMLEER